MEVLVPSHGHPVTENDMDLTCLTYHIDLQINPCSQIGTFTFLLSFELETVKHELNGS